MERSWKAKGGLERSWKVKVGLERSWKVKGGLERSWKVTGWVEKVLEGQRKEEKVLEGHRQIGKVLEGIRVGHKGPGRSKGAFGVPYLEGNPAALIRTVSKTPQALNCCTTILGSNLQRYGPVGPVGSWKGDKTQLKEPRAVYGEPQRSWRTFRVLEGR